MASTVIDSPAEITPEEVEKNQTDNPEQTSTNNFGFSQLDWLLVGAGAVALFLVNHFFGGITAAVAGMAGAGCMYRWHMGRTYKLFAWTWLDLWIYLRGGLIYDAEPTRAVGLKSRLHSPPFPIDLYEIRNTPAGNIGLAYNHKTRQDTLVIEIRGSAILSKNLTPMNESLAFLSDMVKKIVSIGGSNVGVAFVAHKRPLNMWRISKSYASNIHPDVAFPRVLRDNVPESEWTARDHRLVAYHRINMEQLPAAMRNYGKEFTMAMVLTIQRPKGSPFQADKRGKRKAKEGQIRRSSAIKVAQTAIDELKRLGMAEPRVLDLAGLQGYFRALWDISDVHDYHDWAETADEKEVLNSDRHWPQRRIRVRRDHMLIDEKETESGLVGNYHAHILLTKHPPKSLPDYILNLYGVQIPYMAVSSVGVPVSYRMSYEALKRGVPAREAILQSLGYVNSHPEMEMTGDRLRKKQWQLALSRFVDKRLLMVTVSNTTQRGLEENVDEAMRHFNLNNFGPKLVKVRCRQKPALITAAGIPML